MISQIEKLLAKLEQISVSAGIEDNDTLLHTACKNGNMKAVKHLLEIGADVNAKNNKGHTPLYYAQNNPKLAVYLIAHGAR